MVLLADSPPCELLSSFIYDKARSRLEGPSAEFYTLTFRLLPRP